MLIEEKDAVTTVLATSVKFLAESATWRAASSRAHGELTDWIKENPEEAQRMVRAELSANGAPSDAGDCSPAPGRGCAHKSTSRGRRSTSWLSEAQTVGFLQEPAGSGRFVERIAS